MDNIVERVRKIVAEQLGVNQADIAFMLEDNPRRFFAGEVLPAA